MKHRFYIKSKKEQNKIQAVIALAALLIIVLVAFLSWLTGFYWLIILAFPITLSIIAPFFDIPSLKESGRLIYYSPLFVAEKLRKGVIKIHGGSLFDYVFVIDRNLSGKARTNLILQQYLEGLLNLIEENENKSPQNIKVRGTSYIISKRTAERIGFKVIQTDTLASIILTYNYFNLMASYSLAKAKVSFPKLRDTKTFEADLIELLERKDFIKNLNEKLKASIHQQNKPS